MEQKAFDKKTKTGRLLSAECCLNLHDIMGLNAEDVEVQAELQRAINLLLEKFPGILPVSR